MSQLEFWAVVRDGKIVYTDPYREGVKTAALQDTVVRFVPYVGRRDPALKALKALLKAHEGMFSVTECLRLPAYVAGRQVVDTLEKTAAAQFIRETAIAAFDAANRADTPGWCKHKPGDGMCSRCEPYAGGVAR